MRAFKPNDLLDPQKGLVGTRVGQPALLGEQRFDLPGV